MEISIEHQVLDFKKKKKLEREKAQEEADRAMARKDKENAIRASQQWAHICQEEHRKMVTRRNKEREERNRQLKLEADELKAAVKVAKASQLKEDKEKITALKRLFAERKEAYMKEKAKIEKLEAAQLAKVQKAHNEERILVMKQREDEQKQMRAKLVKTTSKGTVFLSTSANAGNTEMEHLACFAAVHLDVEGRG